MVSRRDFVGLAATMGMTLLAGCAQRGADDQKAADTGTTEPGAQLETASEPSSQLPDDAVPSEEQPQDAQQGTAEAPADAPAPELTGPVLVAYFSRAGENFAKGTNEWLYEGHTKTMAHQITMAIPAEEFEIIPLNGYPEVYDECLEVAKKEQEEDARPPIYNQLPDMATYGTIFIGCPIWWERAPMIMRTFLEGVNLAGKNVVPFTTHGGSGLGTVPFDIQTYAPEAHVLEGHAVEGTAVNEAYEEVAQWVRDLNINLG